MPRTIVTVNIRLMLAAYAHELVMVHARRMLLVRTPYEDLGTYTVRRISHP